MCVSVSAVGVPRLSCNRMRSDRPAELADFTRSGRMRFPRFSLIPVGNSNLTSFAKAANLADGSLEVVFIKVRKGPKLKEP